MRLNIHTGLDGRLVVQVALSRRNLAVLLTKLEGRPDGSLCTIAKSHDDEGGPELIVVAEPDEYHYAFRGYPPGEMHPDTEAQLEAVAQRIILEDD